MKLTFLMSDPDSKKHSTRFNFEKLEKVEDQNGSEYTTPPFDVTKFKPSFYIDKPLGEKAKRLRVTIEEL